MNLWQKFSIKNMETENNGFSLHFDKGIDERLKSKFLNFAKYLRGKYCFPVHINIYIKNCERIRLKNGKMAYGNFRWFEKRTPYISIPSKPESYLFDEYTEDEVHEQILSSLVHELTHYFQWVLDLPQSNAVSERQANYFRYRIIEEYYDSKCN